MSECHARMCVRAIFLSSSRLIIKIILILNHSPSPPPSSQSSSSPPTPNIHIHATPPKHKSPYSYSLPLSHLTLPILMILLLVLPTPTTHLFCTSLMVIFSGFDDLLWMHVYHVHVMMHIVMLKWCIRCYIVWAHVTRDASAKARAYSRRHALF